MAYDPDMTIAVFENEDGEPTQDLEQLRETFDLDGAALFLAGLRGEDSPDDAWSELEAVFAAAFFGGSGPEELREGSCLFVPWRYSEENC